MGVASFSVGTYGKRRGSGAATVFSSNHRTSGTHSTTTSASTLSDGASVTLASGEVLQIHADEAMRIRFGGVAATTNTGHYIPAGQQREFECNDPGTISIIDVA